MWWIFGTKVDAAFSSWIWPLLGLLFLPWTTIAYVLAWGPVYGVSGFWGWQPCEVKPEKFTNYEIGVKWDVAGSLALTADPTR